MNTCKVCGNSTEVKFEELVLRKYSIKYYQCTNCSFLFTESPFWLEESYKHAINISDTGILMRNIHFAKQVSVLLYFFFEKKNKFLDYAGGFGIFTRLMRDIGFDYYWNDEYCDNLIARGFESDVGEKNTFEAISALEVFEHFNDPIRELSKMLKSTDSIIFSTEILPDKLPNRDWWYYGFEHGQHLSFYSRTSLNIIAQKLGLNFYSFRGLHILTKRKLNPVSTQLVLALSKFGLFAFVKLRMKSKLWEDHLQMKSGVTS